MRVWPLIETSAGVRTPAHLPRTSLRRVPTIYSPLALVHGYKDAYRFLIGYFECRKCPKRSSLLRKRMFDHPMNMSTLKKKKKGVLQDLMRLKLRHQHQLKMSPKPQHQTVRLKPQQNLRLVKPSRRRLL